MTENNPSSDSEEEENLPGQTKSGYAMGFKLTTDVNIVKQIPKDYEYETSMRRRTKNRFASVKYPTTKFIYEKLDRVWMAIANPYIFEREKRKEKVDMIGLQRKKEMRT